jgi:predicted ArsR family transcriptional regulator
MILSELKSYLRQRKRASLPDMANRFDADAEALRGMLGVLENKGLVRKLSQQTACGSGCGKCDQAGFELYELVE